MNRILSKMLCGFISLAAAQAHSNAVVIKSDAAALPIGSIIADGTSIEIGAAETITFILKSGAATTISGPYAGLLDASGLDSGAPSAIAGLLRSRGKGISQLGAVRNSAAVEADRPVVKLLLGETSCLATDARPVMTIPPRSQPQLLVLAGPATTTIEWPASTAQMDWPEALPLRDGATYKVTLDDLNIAVFEIKLIDDAETEIGIRAKNRIEAGCLTDALKLLAEVN